MGTIQDKLNILASTTEAAVQSLSQEELEEEKKNASVVDYKMVTFSLAGKDYAIDIMKVKEIAKAGNFTYVPNTLPFVLGVYNLRGEIIPIIDLRLFFNIEIPPHDSNVLENMLIVQVGEQFFGVVVDVIDKVVGIQKSTIQPPHPLFGDINIKYISGVVEAQRHLYILLDIDKIFGLRTPEEERLLAETARAQLEDRQAAAAEIAAREEAARQAEETAKSSGKKNFDLFCTVQILHKRVVLLCWNTETVKQSGGIAFRIPSVHLGKFCFQFGSTNSVFIGEVFFHIDGIFFFHDVIKTLISHDNGIKNTEFVVFEVVLFQNGKALTGSNDDITVSGF